MFISLLSLQAFAQQHAITGKITDFTDGTALPGVNVVISGTTTGTSTDFDGVFKLVIPNNDVTLEFSYLGYVTQIIKAGNQAIFNIKLKESSNKLDEIVVIGYGSVKKKDLTGAIVSLGDDEMTSGAATISAAQMIQGRAAGVEVSANDGEPGQGMNITIRGGTSISNSNQPLYVVDGFPIDAGVSIAPEDIETIDILKDAASAAIYGSRGSSGVVLITTKRGRAGKTDISVTGYTGIQQINGSLPYLNWTESAALENADYALRNPTDPNPKYYPEDVNSGINTDWMEEGTRDAMVKNYTLRASGGDDKSHFSLSAGYFDQEGIFINTGFRRVNVRLNADRKFGEKTKVGMNIYSSKVDGKTMDKRPGSRTFSPIYQLLRAQRGRAAWNDDGTLAHTEFVRDQRVYRNPIGMLTERKNDILEWRTYANMYIDYNILENFVFRVNTGVDHTARTVSEYQPLPYSNWGSVPLGSIAEGKSTSYLIEGTLDYKLEFSENHSLGFLAGASTQKSEYFSFSAFGTDFPTDKTSYYNLGSAANQFISSYKEEQMLISFFGRASYNFKDRFLINATIRADGASKFGENNKWGYFPSASAAWNIDNEAFLIDSDLVSGLKLRASYGVTGNNNFSPYTSLARVGATDAHTFDGTSYGAGLGPDGVFAPNPDLKWETTYMMNFGLDFGLWDHRLFGTFEYYQSTTEDLIIDKPISRPSSGYEKIRANVGTMENVGFEVMLGADIIRNDTFKWTTNFNWSTNDNEITELDGENPIVIRVARQPYGEIGEHAFRELVTGGKIGDFTGYVYKGVLQPGEVYAPQPGTTKPGMALFEDLNGDGIIDNNDREVIGNANPDFIWGWNNHFELGGFYLDMFWQGVVGNDIFNFKAITSDQWLSEKAAERWSPTNTGGTRPGTGWFANGYGSYVNSEFIEDGSYVRLKNLALGFNVNTDAISWIKEFNVYVQGQNLVTLTDYTGLDPEVSFNYNGTQSAINRGVDDYGYPNYKTYTLGVKLTF